MQAGDAVRLAAVQPQQHFTEPPPRYTEASLVKTLEEYGIGRPSTYASIISTLRDREYVEIENRRFTATDIGKIVNRFLTDYFNRYVDYGFTAAMEDELDAVSRGEEPWTTPLSKFWKPFIEQVEDVEKNVSREQVAQARELGRDPASGKPVSVRMGRFGPFVQIGTKDDEEKPRFAGLRPGQKMDSITLEQGLELFKLPRTLGTTAEGEPIIASVGRFGPYLKYGSKYVSLKDDPYTIGLERALECIRIKQEADANRIIQDFPAAGIQVLNGRYGPYVSNREKNARIPKDRDPKSLTLEECRALLEAAPARGQRGRGRFGARKVAPAAAESETAGPKSVLAKPAASKPAAPKPAASKPSAARTAASKPAAKAAAARPQSLKPVEPVTALAARRTAAAKVKRLAARKPAHHQPEPAAARGKAVSKSRSKTHAKSGLKAAGGGARSRAGAKKAAGAA